MALESGPKGGFDLIDVLVAGESARWEVGLTNPNHPAYCSPIVVKWQLSPNLDTNVISWILKRLRLVTRHMCTTAACVLGACAHANPYQDPMRCTSLPAATVTEEFDRFRNRSILKLERLGFGQPLPVVGTGICWYGENLLLETSYNRADSEATPTSVWTFITLQPPTERSTPDVVLLLNGVERIPLRVIGYERRGGDAISAFHTQVDVPYATLIAALQAHQVELAVGRIELSLTPHHLAALGEYRAKLPHP